MLEAGGPELGPLWRFQRNVQRTPSAACAFSQHYGDQQDMETWELCSVVASIGNVQNDANVTECQIMSTSQRQLVSSAQPGGACNNAGDRCILSGGSGTH